MNIQYAIRLFSFFTLLSILSTLSLSGCGGGSSDGGGSLDGGGSIEPRPLVALYSNGANWNDYVKNDGANLFDATDTACEGTETGGYSACLHGGEMQTVEVATYNSCAGLTATDALDAFNWTCSAASNPVKMISTGLKDGRNLSDLIDFTTPAWLQNSVTVHNGSTLLFTTDSSIWWNNPILIDNDGMSAGDALAGTIYVITANAIGMPYVVDANRVALLIQPTVTLTGSASTDENVISVDTQNFFWLEGEVDATGDDRGIFWDTVRFSVLRNLKVANADNGGSAGLKRGIHLSASSNNRLTHITSSDNGGHGLRLDNASNNNSVSNVSTAQNSVCGVYLNDAVNNELSNITANNNVCGVYLIGQSDNNTMMSITTSNNQYGVYLATSSNNKLQNITTSNNQFSGVHLDEASNNSLDNIVTANNGIAGTSNGGVVFSGAYGPVDGNILSNITASNNYFSGMYLYIAENNSLSNIITANNGTANFGGVVLNMANNNTLGNVAAFNGLYGFTFWESADNYFTGQVKVGGNSDDCYLYLSATPGLDTVCGNTGSSDAVLTTGITLADSFIAKVTTDDAQNTSDTDGVAAYLDITDWTSFENIYRTWGQDGGVFPASDQLEQCVSGNNCRIWDWSLASTDTVVRNVVTQLPTGDDVITHTWYTASVPTSQGDCDAAMPGSVFNVDHCENIALRNASEIMADGIGNDNGLCESNETCLYTTNIGGYQGHGGLVSAGSFVNGELTDINLMQYQSNGDAAMSVLSAAALTSTSSSLSATDLQRGTPVPLDGRPSLMRLR